MKKEHTIDAAGKTLGRVASEAAKALMGKMRADYTPNIHSDVKVHVSNINKLYTREKKRKATQYVTYSGYPGGKKTESLAQLTSRRGYSEALRRAVRRMLPRNTMLVARLKNLSISQ